MDSRFPVFSHVFGCNTVPGLLLVILSVLTFPGTAGAQMTYPLPNNAWRQISLPCAPGNEATPQTLFGDDQLGRYGQDWVMYRFDPSIGDHGSYVNVGSNGTLSQASGYWILQRTGSAKSLTLPDSCGTTPVSPDPACPSSAGCFSAPLAARPNTVAWNMMGFPFPVEASAGGLRVATQTGDCASGCNLDGAAAARIAHNILFSYSGSGYDQVDTRTTLGPWQGYWMATLDQAAGQAPVKLLTPTGDTTYPWHHDISTTVFWVGETASTANGQIANTSSAWDDLWMDHYGGIDDPDTRNGFQPASFTPKENSFHFALPYNDFDANGERRADLASHVPWVTAGSPLPEGSVLKNRWIEIRFNGKTAYAQWEDVGPFGENDWPYVFGDAAPANTVNAHAGLDVSPAVRDALGLSGIDQADWRFVDASDVPDGPWKQTVTTTPTTWIDIYQPPLGVSWQWQLSGAVNTAYDATIYDIDLFDSSTELIDNLHAQGRKVICYFSAGSHENWRADQNDFPPAIIGQPLDGWAGERWLDIRADALKPILARRLDLAVEKGCDCVEPDNVDGYTNDTGFPLTANDQLAFNRFLAREAHQRGLAIGLKNDLDQVTALQPFFEFAVNEQCHEFDECDLLTPFIDAGKPVLNAEYRADYVNDRHGARQTLCSDANQRQFSTLVLPLDLDDSFRYSCSN